MGLYPILSLFSCVVHHGTTQRSKWSDKFPWSPLPPALPYPSADSELNHWWLLAWHLTQKKATSWAKKGNHFQLHAITSVHCSYMHRWWPGAHGLQNLARILKTRTHTCPHWTALVPLRFGSLQHVLLCFCEWPEKHANENTRQKFNKDCESRVAVLGNASDTEPSTSGQCLTVKSTGPRHQEKGHVSGKERIQAISGSPAMSALNKKGYWKSSSIIIKYN